MKYTHIWMGRAIARSLPARGAWIEIGPSGQTHCRRGSLPARGAWIEIERTIPWALDRESLPARGAWIEILPIPGKMALLPVAPREGSVD